MLLRPFFFLLSCGLLGCDVTTDPVDGIVGKAGQHSPVYRDTQGNILGYYEYLPLDFKADKIRAYPLIFYWNGANAIRGNGREDLDRLLVQGLPELINQGKNYPAIIISGMMNNWKTEDPQPFVKYILNRYRDHYDPARVYMTGFSAGGGVTIRYVSAHPERIAAIVPIAAAAPFPEDDEPTPAMAAVPSWLFHNIDDPVVKSSRSKEWHQALKKAGGDHRITLRNSESHYAWQATYESQQMWEWLFAQKKTNNKPK